MIKTKFETASDAFNYFFPKIMWDGVKFDNTMALFNIGFYIEKPMWNHILAEHRNGTMNMQRLNGNGTYQVILM